MRRDKLVFKGIKSTWPRLIGLRRERLVLVEGRDLAFVLEFDGERILPIRVANLGWAPSSIAISPTARHMILRNSKGNFAEVRSVDSLQLVTTVAGPERIAAALVSIGEEDLLIQSRRPGVLEGFRLPSLEPSFEVGLREPTPFVVSAILPLEDGDNVVVTGHRFLELEETSSLLSLQLVVSDPRHADASINASFTSRRAGRLCAGTSALGEWLLWRQPLGASTRSQLSILASYGDAPAVEVRLPNDLTQIDALMGLPDSLVLVGQRRLVILSRGDGSELARTSQVYTSFDPGSGRIACIDEERRIELFQMTVD